MTILSKLTSNGNENTVNVLKNIANAVVIKGGGIIVGLLTTPAYMDYFSKRNIRYLVYDFVGGYLDVKFRFRYR